MHAYCYASGHIAFGPEVPPEALPLAEGPRKPLMDFISSVARHSRTSDVLFVPGIPETQGDQDAALDALLAFTKWAAKGVPKSVTIIHSKHRPRKKLRTVLDFPGDPDLELI